VVTPRLRSRLGRASDLGAWSVVALEGNDGPHWVDSSGSVAVPRTAGIGASCPLALVPGRSLLRTDSSRSALGAGNAPSAQRVFVECTTYALASRLRAS
jgi:hypothetical protein